MLQTFSLTVIAYYVFVGFIGPAICLVVTGWIECDAAGAVTMIVIAVGVSGISMAGWAVNHLDLAPPFAGISFFVVSVRPINRQVSRQLPVAKKFRLSLRGFC